MFVKFRPSFFVSLQLRVMILLAVLWSSSTYAEDDKNSLVLFIWQDYISLKVIAAFEKETGIKVRQVNYETDDLKDEMLITTGGKGLDLIVGSGVSFLNYTKRGWLHEWNSKDIDNIKHVDPRWLKLYPQLANHAVPYLWGPVGIAYRADLVKNTFSSWLELFKPDPAIQGHIMMINDSREVIGAALKALGYSLNSSDPTALKKVEELLLAQQPFVKAYSYLDLNEKSDLVTGKIWVSMIYNGDALLLSQYNKNIKFAVPAEGCDIAIDYIAVLKASEHKNAAQKFINFINKPEHAAAIAAELFYATPNKSAEGLLPKEMLANPIIYPDQKVLDKSESFIEHEPKELRLRNNVFSKLLLK